MCGFTIDLRAPSNALRDHAASELEKDLRMIAAQRDVSIELDRFYTGAAITCSPRLTGELVGAIERAGIRPLELRSGAGHDGIAIADLCPIAMLFLRCKNGISHNPAEAIHMSDAITAVDVILDFLLTLDPRRMPS